MLSSEVSSVPSVDDENEQQQDQYDRQRHLGGDPAGRQRVDPARDLLRLVVGERVYALAYRRRLHAERCQLPLHIRARHEALHLVALRLDAPDRLPRANHGRLRMRRIRQHNRAHDEKPADKPPEKRFHVILYRVLEEQTTNYSARPTSSAAAPAHASARSACRSLASFRDQPPNWL